MEGELYDMCRGSVKMGRPIRISNRSCPDQGITFRASGHQLEGDILDNIYGQSGITWSGRESERDYVFQSPAVGFDFIETLGIKIVEGRTFAKERHDNYSKIILNESAVKLMGLQDPIGKTINMNGGSEIVGVVRDFHYGSLREQVHPLILRCDPNGRNVMVKIRPDRNRSD